MSGWAFCRDLVKSAINQRLIGMEQNVPCFPLPFAVFFLCHCEGEQEQGFEVFSSEGQLLLPPEILFDFLKMSQSFSARVWCRLSLFLWAPLCKAKKHIASQAKQVCTIEDFLTTKLCQVCSQPCTESCYSSARSYRPKIITDVYLSQRILSTPKHQGKKTY